MCAQVARRLPRGGAQARPAGRRRHYWRHFHWQFCAGAAAAACTPRHLSSAGRALRWQGWCPHRQSPSRATSASAVASACHVVSPLLYLAAAAIAFTAAAPLLVDAAALCAEGPQFARHPVTGECGLQFFDDTGTAAGVTGSAAEPTAARTAAWLDANLDGRLDLITAGQPPYLFLGAEPDDDAGEAAPRFAPRQRLPCATGSGAPYDGIVCGDLDGDGDDDCIITSTSHRSCVLVNDVSGASGAFSQSVVQGVQVGFHAHAAVLADVDGDGGACRPLACQ